MVLKTKMLEKFKFDARQPLFNVQTDIQVKSNILGIDFSYFFHLFIRHFFLTFLLKILTFRGTFSALFRIFKFSSFFYLMLMYWMFLPFQAMAQLKTGISISNYAGINSVSLNPSSTSNSKLFADVNLFSGGVFFDNNFLFIHKEDYKLLNFLKKKPSLPSAEIKGEGLDYSTEWKSVDGFVQADVFGPGFSMSMGKHTFGIFSKVSTITSIDDLPYETAVLAFEGIDYDTLLGTNVVHSEFATAAVSWWEVGGHYSQILSEKGRNVISFGANIRKLYAWAGGYAQGNNINYTLDSDSLQSELIYNLDIESLDAAAAFSAPLNYDSIYYPTGVNDFKGSGWAGDIGITFRKNRFVSDNFRYRRPCEKPYDDYLYKIGLSIMDIGNVIFKKNIQLHEYENINTEWLDIESLEYENLNQVISQISYELTGDSASTRSSGSFAIGLPAALGFQSDIQYFPKWYLSALAVIPLRLNDIQIKRPSQALISLRYETPTLEFGIPVSLYNFQAPRIGLYARFNYFTIGTDKLGGFFGLNDFYGLDFYFAIKYHILKGVCGLKKPAGNCNHLSF